MGRIFPTCLMMKQPRLRHVGIWLTMPLITVGVCFASIHWFSQFLFLALKDHAGWTMFFFYLRELISGNMSKEPKDCRETYSQIKRRRMLQFDTQVVDSSLCSDEMPSPFLKSNVSAGHISSLWSFCNSIMSLYYGARFSYLIICLNCSLHVLSTLLIFMFFILCRRGGSQSKKYYLKHLSGLLSFQVCILQLHYDTVKNLNVYFWVL